MPKIQNNFTRGIIDKDSDERLVQNGVLIDAENFLVSTTEGSNAGVGKNVPGNSKKSNYNISGGKTIGRGANESKNKSYNFVKGTTHDYIIEFDVETEVSVIVLQASTGGVLNFQDGERITNVDIISSGETDGDLLAWSGDSNPPRIVNIARAKTWAIDGFTEDEISVMKPAPLIPPTLNLTISDDGVENNFIRDRFLCFAYRYKYNDGFYSAPSSWSKIAFEPDRFRLDYQTYENNGMLNVANSADVTFNVGGRDVVNIDLLFRDSNTSTVYVVESFNKSQEGWADNSNQTFKFSKSKIFKVLPEEQYFRNFDNVPLSTVAQTLIGNRIAYANYIEGYDLGVNIDFDATFTTTDPFAEETSATITDFTDITDYSNLVDFEDGDPNTGSNPVDQMNFATNTISVNLAVTGSPTNARFEVSVTPKSSYGTSVYTVTFKEGATVLQTNSGLTGNQTVVYDRTTNGDVTIFVTSDDGLIYDLDLNYRLYQAFIVSEWDYAAIHQLSYPKSTGYGATLVGDVIIEHKAEIDTSGIVFDAGQQIRLNFELKSSLVNAFTPSVTFFYNLTNSYTNLADFITNSSFKESLEGAFSDNFQNVEISNEGTTVTYQGFLVTYSGSTLIIQAPQVVYEVTEPSTVVENKNEFYLFTSLDLVVVNQDAFTSLHSNRDYEVAMIYLDDKGRKTTALTSPNNSFFIPAENSITSNKASVTINHNPPSWARYYKFAIKQVKKDYEIVYGNKVFKDGIYRWIELVGENKNKVKEGDVLILKSDYSGVLEEEVEVKVLEVKTQSENFIEGNLKSNGAEIVEEPGLYFKIKQGNFNINIDDDSFKSYIGNGKRRYATRSFVSTSPIFGDIVASTFEPTPVLAGTQIRFFIEIKAYGSIAFSNIIDITQIAQDDYASIKAWWEAEIEILDAWDVFQTNYLRDWDWGELGDGQVFRVKPWRDGTASRDIITDVIFDVAFSGGTLVFETTPNENLADAFYETPEVFEIVGGNHQANPHILTQGFNCFVFGNGVESYKIQDTFIGKSFSIDSNPTAVDEEGYKQRKRFADITYSGIFNSNTGLNRLNEFNLSLANYKDDIEKEFGDIYKIKGQDTNLDVYQEDKCSVVFYGKDLLFNADGSTNLSRIEEVLGQQKTDGGEYGISQHPESHDDYAFNAYLTDVKRGVVLKRNYNNGLFEISFQGMRDYFKKLFRDNTINNIIGHYDQFHDYYILNIQYNDTEYVTWVYSDKDNGWLGRLKFNPEAMIRVNNHLLSFKNGEVYKHNDTSIYNTFYGVESPSTFSFNFSQDPSVRKHFKNISIEGTVPTDIVLTTELDNGYINKEDFEKKERVFYAYVRNSNNSINTELLSCQGIGEATINGLILEFGQNLSTEISVGDEIRNANLQLVGTIQSKTKDTLTLDTVNNIVSGDFVLATKPASIEEGTLTGYYMRVDCEFESTTAQEIFAINSEVSKSYE